MIAGVYYTTISYLLKYYYHNTNSIVATASTNSS